ncbi:glucan 1,3-beta-glucosidase [Tremella mesenterica]|uniref:glucan 1,3-beta-glucosidase n=1 Tax=Tremella mesenterica TaxID=5217 RepID=A0A4V1M470_TREME|nr:glucan 1,3-beta-glucosidase [Tremella mesenterica]
MVSPIKRPFPNPPSDPVYTSVPTDPNTSDIADSNMASARYSALSGPSISPSLLSPDLNESTTLFGRSSSAYLPAPSIISRDSTHTSLPGTPPMGAENRQSWGSGVGFAADPAAIAGAEHVGRRGPSALNRQVSSGSERTSEDEEQGHVAPALGAGGVDMSEKPRWAQDGYIPKKSRKPLWIGLGVGAVVIIAAAAIGLGVGLTRNHSTNASTTTSDDKNGGNSDPSSSKSATGTASSTAPTPTPTSGGTGSLITLEDGSTFTYENPFGGQWVWDPSNPFNNDAQANSWTPSLNSTWNWGIDKIYGVNLGGWLVTEPFIVPAMYEKYATGPGGTAVDEYTLSLNMGSNLTAAMTEHYETFITERDFADIARAGLNWVRIPIPHWAIETLDGEPYLERVAWTYFLKAIQWARKYGIRINLDLHTVPGSQNGWNHSGHLGQINWMNGVMGLANAQRALEYIRTLAQFISQEEYAPVVQLFGFINEPNAGGVGQSAIGSFYYEAYKTIRDITGIGTGKGPFLSFHDGFLGISQWYGFLPGADRLGFDNHPYLIFGDQPTGTLASIAKQPCSNWGASTNDTLQQYGMIVAGEWSAAPNDCGLWINNVGAGSRYDGSYAGYTGPKPGSCDQWNDWTQWDQSTIDSLLDLTTNSMDALQNWFFWTWKIGNSTGTIQQVNPFWHYQLGYNNGWLPKDPRSHFGACAAAGISVDQFDGTFASPYMTGGSGAGTIPAAMSASYPWPVSSLTNIDEATIDLLPQYTQTGTPISMPGPTFTSPGSSATIDSGNGWANANADGRQAYVAVADCSYPSEYSAADLTPTKGACGAGLIQPTRRAILPTPTPAPIKR